MKSALSQGLRKNKEAAWSQEESLRPLQEPSAWQSKLEGAIRWEYVQGEVQAGCILMFLDTPHGDHRATRDSNSLR